MNIFHPNKVRAVGIWRLAVYDLDIWREGHIGNQFTKYEAPLLYHKVQEEFMLWAVKQFLSISDL